MNTEAMSLNHLLTTSMKTAASMLGSKAHNIPISIFLIRIYRRANTFQKANQDKY